MYHLRPSNHLMKKDLHKKNCTEKVEVFGLNGTCQGKVCLVLLQSSGDGIPLLHLYTTGFFGVLTRFEFLLKAKNEESFF